MGPDQGQELLIYKDVEMQRLHFKIPFPSIV